MYSSLLYYKERNTNSRGKQMSEIIPEVPAVPVVEPGVNPEVPEVDVKAEIEKVKLEMAEQFKSEIAGLNRKNSEYEKEIKAKELEGKSEAEQKELLLLEKEAIQKEIIELNRGRIVDKTLNDSGLPLDFAKRIIGADEVSIVADIKVFSEFIEATAQKRAESIINERLGGKTPEAGVSPAGGVDEQIKQAQQKGDFVTVMTLKEQKRMAN
jgi:hypothetical protein